MLLHNSFLRNLDWNLLYTFVVIVEEGSITGAARKLNFTQPSISNALRRLETFCGERLIIRNRGGISLTHQGRRLYDDALAASNIVRKLAKNFTHEADIIAGEIVLHSCSKLYSPPYDTTLSAFHELYPQVTYLTETLPSSEIARRLSQGEIRIGLCTAQKHLPGLKYRLIGQEPIGFYCGQGHPLFNKKELSIEDLAEHSYVTFKSDQPTDGMHAVANYRLENNWHGDLVGICQSDEEVTRMIMAGIGFGPLSVYSAAPFVQQKKLFQLPPYHDLPSVDLFLATNPSHPLTRLEEAFVDMLDQQATKAGLSSHPAFPPGQTLYQPLSNSRFKT